MIHNIPAIALNMPLQLLVVKNETGRLPVAIAKVTAL